MNPSSELLEALRTQTREHHHAVEEKLHLLDGRLTRERYGDVLGAFLDFYTDLQSRWQSEAPALPWTPDFSDKIEALSRDLRALGREPRARIAGAAQDALGPGWWGVLYVTEGSNLGGQVIVRRLREEHPELGEALHFYGGGADTGKRWREFLGLLTADERLPHRDRITAAANVSFAALTDRF